MATSTNRPGQVGAQPPGLAEPDHEELWDAVGSDAEDALGNVTRLLFQTRAEADEAVEVLCSMTPAKTVSVRPAAGLHAVVMDREARTATSAARLHGLTGAVVGIALGVIAALAGLADLPTTAALVLLGLLGGGFGFLVGALVGLARTDPMDDDPTVEVDAGQDAVVVTVRSLRAARIREVGRAMGGVPIDPRTPLSSP